MSGDSRPVPLDADARRALDLLAATGRPPVQRMTPAEAREAARAGQKQFDGTPPPARIDDLAVPAPAGPIRLRRYRPSRADADAPLPALVYYHGGGWVAGDLGHAAWLCASLAERLGIAVVSVDYRLAPEAPFPAAVEDSLAALEWIAEAGDSIGIDRRRLAVGGDSAGGALAAVAALHARDRGLALRAQVLLYPVTDNAVEHPSYAQNAEGYGLTAEGMRWYRNHYLAGADPSDWRASPLHAERLDGTGPALVLTCGYDVLGDEGDLYAERLAGAGVPVRHRHYPGQIHGFVTRAGVIGEAQQALADVESLLRETLLG